MTMKPRKSIITPTTPGQKPLKASEVLIQKTEELHNDVKALKEMSEAQSQAISKLLNYILEQLEKENNEFDEMNKEDIKIV